jgi:alpha-L-fucosidase
MTTRFKFKTTIVRLALGCVWATLVLTSDAAAQTRYTASWASVDTHDPAPEWFQDAKFGIYYHWGAFCVAAYSSEWYPKDMYTKGGGVYDHHMSVFGDPFSDWPYNKFLTGANDKSGKLAKFEPKLKSAGGNWDPEEWAQMFADAGAKYAGPVAEHHDGFSMWDSKVNEWNSVLLGPKLNLGKLHADAIRKKGMKLIMSHHTAYNFTGFYGSAPKLSDPSLQKLYGQLPNADEQTLWLNKLKEIIDQFMPDIIWQDFNLGQISTANLTAFLAYYYNAGLDANKEVVATGKDGLTPPTHKGQVLDYERGGPAGVSTPYWLTDDAVSSSSWSYTTGMQYYSTTALIHSFVDRVSKGGNLLLNLSPMADGTFPQQQKDILTAFGKFLRQNGTAIYNTRLFSVYGEGPTKMGGGGMGQPSSMTATDIRYTKSKDGDAVYAIVMGWPGNGKQVNLTSVTTAAFPLGSGKVFLFGPSGNGGDAIPLQATQDSSGVHVTLPATQPYTSIAYAIKISKSGKEPDATPWTASANPGPDGGVGGADGNGGGLDAGVGGAGVGRPDAGAAGSGGSLGPGGRTGTGGVGGANSSASSAGGTTGAGGSTGGTTGSASSRGGSGGDASSAGAVATAGGSAGASAVGGLGADGATVVGSGGAANSGTAASTSGGGPRSSGTTGKISEGGSGCSCSTPGSGRASAGVWLLLLGLVVASLTRRRQR